MTRIRWMVMLLLASTASLAVVRPTFGRPLYKGAFKALYEQQYANSTERWNSCTVCHLERKDGEHFRQNNYGEALGESLGQRKVDDKQAILQALQDTEKKPSAVPGMTFGELINAGRLPASK